MKKIKVMHVLNTGGYSGAEHVVIDLIKATKERCESVYVAKEGNIRDILKKEKVTYIPIKKMSFFEIRKQIDELKPDIIHAHDFTAGIICSVFNRKAPVINHLHNNALWIRKKNVKSFIYFRAAKKISCILTVSEAVMSEYIYGKKLTEKTKVVGNPFDAAKIRNLAELDCSDEKYDILFCGRFFLPKNPIVFVQIVSELKKKIPNINAAMIGDGEMRGQVTEAIEHLNLKKNIKLYGFMSNPYGIMKNSKLLCVPSLWEGFGLVSLEAMSLGIPVLASPVGGLINIVDDSCGALCYRRKDFVNKIYELLTMSHEYEKKSKGALERADVMDNLKEYSDLIVHIYGQFVC